MNCSNSWKIEIPTSEVFTSWDREESESEITKCSLALRVASPPGSQSELCTTCWTPRCKFLSKSNENSLSHGFNSTCGGEGQCIMWWAFCYLIGRGLNWTLRWPLLSHFCLIFTLTDISGWFVFRLGRCLFIRIPPQFKSGCLSFRHRKLSEMKNLLIVLLLAFCSCKPAEEEDNIRFDFLFSLIFILVIFTVRSGWEFEQTPGDGLYLAGELLVWYFS